MKLKQFIFALVAMLSFSFSAFAQTVTTAEALKAALESTTGSEVVLGGDITLPAQISVPKKTAHTLDLNGHKITGGIYVYGTLTINDNVGTGSITANSYVLNGAGGSKIILNGGRIYRGSSWSVYTTGVFTVNGGEVENTIRVAGSGSIQLNGGTVTAIQVTSGNLNITDDAVVNGNLNIEKGAKGVNIADGTINGDITIATEATDKVTVSGGTFKDADAIKDYLPGGSALLQKPDGTYEIVAGLLKIGDTYYPTLAAALAAAQDGDEIVLINQEGSVIAMNGSLYGKSVTITGTATVDWSKGFLFVARGGEGNATLTFDNAQLTSASDNTSTGIHVSGRQKNTTDKYDGTLVIKNSAIELDYLINKGEMTLDNSSLTVKNGFDLNGRPASETESGEDANATLALTNSSKLVVNNHNGMGIGREGKGELTVDASSTFEHTQDFLVCANGTMDVKGTLVSNGKKLTNNGEVKFTATKLTAATIEGAGTTRFYNDVNFYGANSITTTGINGTPFHLVVNEGANLLISRFTLGYDRNITVNGTIADASAFTPEGQTPSLKFNSTSGVSVGGTDTGNLQVKNAYVELGSSSWKNAQGTYNWNFENSYVSATSFTNATGADAATWDVTFNKSVLAAKNYIKNGKNVTYNFTNNSRGTTGSLRIDGVLNIDATSSVVTTSQQNNVQGAVDEHGGINGTVNVAGNLTIGSNAKTQLEVLGGTVNVEKGATLALGNHTLTLDASSAMQSAGNISGAITAANGADVAISGGTYTQDVSNWCADGYMTQQNADGSFGIAKAVAKVGDKKYASLEEAFKAATSGCTIDILSDVTIDSKWDCRYTGAKFLVPVTINGNGKTIKFTGSVNDMNWNTVFRFEEKAAVNNLTVDISNATGAQRVISAKKSLAVDGLNIVGAAKYGVIYSEGASATDLAATEIVVKNSTLGGTRRALSDNEGGKDVKSVVIESNTFNANVGVSAKETVTFTGNTVAGAYVNIKSYTAGNKLAVTATGNTLEANTNEAGKFNVIDAGGVVNAEGFNIVAKGNNFNGYTGADGIWGETWGNAKESFVVKVLDANGNVMGTTSLNNIGGIINGNVNVSWNLKFNAAANTDEYWTMEWTTAPSISNMPAKVELWVDGTRVSGGDVVLNGPDDLNKIVAAVTDADGKIISCHTSVANAAATNATNIALLRETNEVIKLPAGVELNKNGFTAAGVEVTPVAKVGNTEYSSIDKAIAAWTNGTTLTLLENVTLSDVIKLKSTEHHTLNLGTYTMTAASGKNAIEITCEGREKASYALTVNADANNPGGITATGMACIYYNKTNTVKDRPIILINNGVFNGSYSINSKSNGNTNCPQIWINGGIFNGNVNLTKNLLQVKGGTFNGWINCSGDQNAYRLIAGGTFKQWQFMTADATNKFAVSSAMSKDSNGNWIGTYNVGVHVDDNGYLVVGGDVVTEPGNFEASSANYGGWSSYLKYSSAKENGLYYTAVEEALADNNKTTGVVTVYADKIDMTDISYKGTIIIPEGGKVTITNVPDDADFKVVTTEGNIIVNNNGTYESMRAVAKVGVNEFETVQKALQYAIDNSAAEVVVLTDVREKMEKDFDLVIKANLTIKAADKFTAEAPAKVEFYNEGTSMDFAVGTADGAERCTLTIAENVHFDLVDRVIWLGYYGNNVDVVVNGYFGGYQIWHGANTTVNNGGMLDSHGEAFIMRRNATLTANEGSKVNANYFQIYSGHINATGADITAGLVWVDGAHSYGSEGNVSFTLNNTSFVSNGEVKMTVAEGKNIPVSVTNGSAFTAKGKMTLANSVDVTVDATSSITHNNGQAFKLPVATINGLKYTSLQDAVNAVKNGETIVLVDVVTENVTLTEKVGVYYTINGAENTMNGTINVKALSDTEDNRRITIKNINFVETDNAKSTTFISSVETNHYPQLTIEGCTFTGSGYEDDVDEDVAVAIKSANGVAIKNCTGEGLHSFLQNTSGWNLTIEGVTVTNSNAGLALGTVQGVTIKGSTIDVATYGIRLDANTYNNNAVIESNKVTAFIPVVVRKVNTQSNVTFEGENTFAAENTDGKWMVIGTTEYEENGKLPAEVATGNVVVALNNTNLTYAGIHGAGLAGEGTAEKPYLINNVAELEIFRNSVNAGSAKYSKPGLCIALGADIDMTGVNWVGIGTATADHGFMGNFDGKNFKIKNLTIENPALDSDGYAYAGLFGVTEGTDKDNQNTIKNLTIENVTINTTGDIVSAAIAYPYYTNVDNVKVCGDIKIKGGNYTAGVLAYTRRCVNASNLSIVGNGGSYVEGTQTVGGVISDIQMNGGLTAVYSNFSAEGITVTGEKSVGGIAGIIATQTLNGAAVKNVTLNSTDEFAGVVAGRLGGTSTITDIVAENVTGATAVIGATYDGAKAVEARIGDTYYATLDAALAAEGDEVELFVPVTVAKDETRVLDLNGKTVSHSKACTASYEMIKNLGNLTIKNGTLSFTDTSAGDPSFGWGSYTINNYGTLVVEEGATIQHLGAQAFATHMIAAIQQAKGSTTINAGVISTPNYRSVRINGGALAINGGEFDGQVWLQPNQGDVTIAVNGGTFGPNGGDGSSIFMTNVGENNTVTSASITGGTFTTKIGCTDPAALAGIITGGKFTEAAMTATNGALIGDGFTFDKNAENGYYAVVAGLDGDGTEAAPYMITSVKELELFRESVNKGETKYNASGVWVALGADIDLANAEWTVGIGDGHNYSFDGNFDGKNHIIKNLNIKPYADADNYLCGGLFGYTYGGVTIKNLVIENAEVNFIGETGKDYHCVGILVGFANNNGGKLNVDNVTVKGDIKVDAPQTFGVGAIVGYSYRAMGSITNTKVLANAGSYIKGERFVGGITGYSDANAIIENCTVENLAISGANGVAGIAGLALDGNKITNCTVTNVTVSGDKNVAYIVGELGSGDGGNVLVNNCNAPQPWVGGSYGTGESFVATIGTKYYTSIAKAIEVAKETDVITLIIDITATEPIAIPTGKKVTLDLNGKTITGTDNTTKSYGLININPGAELTINDAAGNGAIMLTATNNRGWNAYSSVISNQRGKLTVNGGTIEHLGGTDMAYAIDNLTNGKGTYAKTIINGGTMKSTYRAVRQFLNGTEAQNILTVNGGTIEGANKSIWMQNANANANPGDLTVAETAEIKGDVYVSGAGAANFPVEISVANAALKDGATVLPSNVHESFAIANNNGVWGITSSVASANGVGYASFLEAIDAAKDDETVTLLADVTLDTKTLATQDDGYAVLVNVKGKAITLDLNGKNVTVDAAAADLASAKSKMLLGVFSADLGGHLTLTDNSDAKNGAVTVNLNDAAVYSVFVSESAQKDKSNSGKITVDGGNYTTVGKVSNAMFFTDANEVITVNGGNFHCDQVSNTANYPWMFNTLGNNELHVIVNGGTFNIDINHQHRPFEVLVPETLAVRANDNGTWTVVEAEAYITEKLGSTVNEAGEWGHNVGYATLAEAIAAVNELGNKVSMAKDVELTETVVVPADKTVVLDLNGKTVSMNDASGAAVALLKNQGNLTIMDGTEAKAGKLSFKTTTPSAANAYASNTISNYGVITIESGNVENLSVGGGACYALDNYAGSTATINGGNLTAEKTAVRIFNWTNGEEAKATINMNGGEIYSKNGYGINVNSGNTPFVALNITGGTITTDYADYKLAVYVVNKGTAENFTANVTGGTFNGIFALNGVTAQTMKQDAVAVSGGTFEGVTCYEDPAYGFVSGGTFKSAVDAKAVATGFICKDNGDGTFGVIVDPKHGMVAQIIRNDYYAENQYFATINDAVQAAQSGETITLIANVETSAANYATIDDTYKYAAIVAVKEKQVTIDLNGKNVTVTPTAEELENAGGKMLMAVFGVDTNGNLTLKGEGTVKVNANGASVYSLATVYGKGGHLTIESGNYEADTINASGSLIYAQQANCITVSGGTFKLDNLGTGANGSPWIFNTKGQNNTGIKVVGGTYPTDINHQFWANEVFVPEHLALQENADGTWTVVEAVAYTYEIASSTGSQPRNVGYASLEDAIAATGKYRCDGNIITMQKDITLEPITVANGAKVVLYLNGKIISGTDSGTASFGLITNKGDLTIEGSGTIQLTATNDRGWGAYSSVISNQVGGKLTVNGGTIQHLGGTSMAYAIDNLTNGKGTYAETEINGGTIKSTYRPIRMFLNGVEAENILTVNAGTIESTGGNKAAIWMQTASDAAHSGTLYVGADAVIKNNVYLDADNLKNVREYPVEAYIAKDALAEGMTVLADAIPAEAAALVEYDTFWQVEQKNLAELTIEDACEEYINKIEKNVAELTYERYFDDTEWQTIVLPFDVPVANLTEQFEVAYIYNASYKGKQATIDYVVIDENSPIETLRANYPYMIRAKKEGWNNIVVENAKLMPTNADTLDCSSIFEKFSFIGNYATVAAPANDGMGYFNLTSEGWSKMDKVNPFRFYMQIKLRNGGAFEYPTNSEGIRMRRVDENGNADTTGIDGIDAENAGDFIFDLHGRRVLEPLKGGLYIINGKKVIF